VGGEIIERFRIIFFSAAPLEHSRYSLGRYNSPQPTFPISQWIPGLFGADLFFSPAEFQLDWVPLSHHSSKTHRPPCSVSYVENEVICLDRVWNLCFLGRKHPIYLRLSLFKAQILCRVIGPRKVILIENEHLLYGFIQRDQPLSMESQLIHSPRHQKGLA